jgi:hypothetical protein
MGETSGCANASESSGPGSSMSGRRGPVTISMIAGTGGAYKYTVATMGGLSEAFDRQELIELVTQYCRALDRCDGELLRSLYHPDAVYDGVFKGNALRFVEHLTGRDDWDAIKTPGPVQHSLSNALFEVHGDVAYGEVYLETRLVRGDVVERLLARYLDRYERRNGRWRISLRRAIIEAGRPGFEPDSSPRGTRDPTDPSYRR